MSVAPSPRVRIGPDAFDLAREIDALCAGDRSIGAIASFIGTVRDRSADASSPDTATLELEHYPGMTEAAIEAMIDAAQARFRIHAARVVHRVGVLAPGDPIVLVLVASAHRGDAFAACEFLMDYLKTQAPLWKKQTRPDGSAEWVDARSADDAALARWGIDARNA
jgi:molybdopterin synthase catalytic subunit